jgi:chemotaxis protein MotB
MGRIGVIIGSIAVMSLASACVSLKEHGALKDQFQKQEAYVAQHRNDVRQASRETTRVALKLRQRELEIQKLQTQNKDLKYKLARTAKKSQETPTAKASFSKAQSARAKPQPASAFQPPSAASAIEVKISGFRINSKSRGIVLDQAKIFAPGSARLKKNGKVVLSKLAKTLNSGPYRSYKIRVEGHTDSSPITRSKSVRDNWQLSGMRARAVLNDLESKGISSKRLSFAGYSFHKPYTKDKSAKASNRRVEILLFD